MEKHITILGALYIAFDAIWILLSLVIFALLVGGGLISGDSDAILITTIVGTSLAIFFFVLSIPGIIGGIGLLKHRKWARILVLILGCFKLIRVPFGTALGIYTIWVLVHDDSARIFSDEKSEEPIVR